MKFLADECCSAHLVKKMRDIGKDVEYVVEEHQGITDKQVLEMADVKRQT